MNQLVTKLLPGHSSRIHIVSLDIHRYIDTLSKSDWSNAIDFVLDGVKQLMNTDVDFVLVCSNTGEPIQNKMNSNFELYCRPYSGSKNHGNLSKPRFSSY